MKRRFKILTAVLAVALASTVLVACHHQQYSGHGDPERMGKKLEKHIAKILNKIDATEEQKSKINLLTGQIIDDAKQLRKQGAGEHDSVVAALLSDHPDSESLHRQVDDKSKVLTEFGHRTVDRLIAINSVLTPEQRTELQKRFASAHGTKEQ